MGHRQTSLNCMRKFDVSEGHSSYHIINCNNCNNEKLSANSFHILKEFKNKFETLISEAILIKRYNPILNKQLTKPAIIHTLRIFEMSKVFK